MIIVERSSSERIPPRSRKFGETGSLGAIPIQKGDCSGCSRMAHSQSFHSVHSRSCLRPARFVVCTHRCQPCSDAAFEEIDRSLLAARSSHGDWPDKQLAWSRALDHGDGGPAPAVGRAASAKQLGWSRNTHSQ